MGSTQSTNETQDAIRDVAHNPSSVTQQDLADWDALVQSFENPTPREVKKRKDPTLVTGYTVEDLHAFDCLAAALEGDVGGEATEEDFRPTRVFDEDDSFASKVNGEIVSMQRVATAAGEAQRKGLIEEHVAKTGSPKGKAVLAKWAEYLPKFWQLVPPAEANTPEATDVVPEEVAASA